MNETTDPFDAKNLLKLATIYRNSEFSYIYICCECECAFTNIEDTFNHVESHFYVDNNLGISGNNTVIQCHQDNKNKLLENINQQEGTTLDDEDAVDIKFECTIDEPVVQHEDNKEMDFSELTNKTDVSQCKLCSRTYGTAQMLIVHMIKHHADMTTLMCPQCSQIWKNDTKFKRHLQQHIVAGDATYAALIDKLMLMCAVSTKKVTEECRQRQHKKDKKPSRFTCDICWLKFSTKAAIRLHLKRAHFTPPEVKKVFFDCEKCKRKIEGRFRFYAHQYGHIKNENSHQISPSDDERWQQNLRKYLQDNIICEEAPPKKIFSCKICDKVSVSLRRSAENHILQRHIHFIKPEIAEKDKQCEYCGKEFKRVDGLILHRRIHTLERPFSCSICQKSFGFLKCLKSHEVIHSDIRPHQCSTCGKAFKLVDRLRRHMLMHLGDSTKCKICGKEVKSHRLKIHMKDVHENEHRPYECVVCLETFKTHNTLRQHSLRHSGEKKYKCRFSCQERFTTAPGRRAHERTRHETH